MSLAFFCFRQNAFNDLKENWQYWKLKKICRKKSSFIALIFTPCVRAWHYLCVSLSLLSSFEQLWTSNTNGIAFPIKAIMLKFFRLKNLKSIRLSICPMRSVKSSNEGSDVVKTFKKFAEMQTRFFHRVV